MRAFASSLALVVALLACTEAPRTYTTPSPGYCATGGSRDCFCDGGIGRGACDTTGRLGPCVCEASQTLRTRRPCACRTGCCSAAICRAGGTDDACGLDGADCVRCAAGEACVARRCVARASSGLSLVIVSARIPTYVPFERTTLGWSWWDLGPRPPGASNTSPEIASQAPDPYVREASGRFRTVIAWNTYSPTWDEVVATG